MSRHEVRAPPPPPLPPPPSKCAKVLYYTWKLCSVVFSHCVMISLVVAYCILGAVTFEKLEASYEREVKMNISSLRANTTESIWRTTNRSLVLRQSNWTRDVAATLRDFENSLLFEMKVRGWDGNEAPAQLQWTFTGALFYSIIVITTIGYGHIAPKTQAGKVVTIFYAIVGIPLMLLCLSNIGDVMASSFRYIEYIVKHRFLYWRVCCYVCTRPPKRRHRRHHSTRRPVVRGSTRRRRVPPAAIAPPPPPPLLERAHSDTDCRYRDSGYGTARGARPRPRPCSQPPAAMAASASASFKYGPREKDRDDRTPPRVDQHTLDDRDDDDANEFPKISLPLQDLAAALKQLEEHQTKFSSPEQRSKSLPRPPKTRPDFGLRNHNSEFLEMHDLYDVDYENYRERKAREMEEQQREHRRNDEFRYERGYRDDRDCHHDKGYRDPTDYRDEWSYRDRYLPEDDDIELDRPRGRRGWSDYNRRNRCRSEYYERDHYDFPYERRSGRRARSAFYDGDPRWDDRRDDYRDLRRDGYRDDWREDRRDVDTGRRRLRRLYTVDDKRPYRYTPSPDRDEWSDDAVVVPRRNRPPAWGSRPHEVYPIHHPDPHKEEIKPVPIWLCVCLVASYIVAGTFLFTSWEHWAYLDAAYFCFITLTTIGFGDFVPAQGQRVGNPADAVHSIALCSLYLLFGIALLAMSFNLVQEEVRANVAALAMRLGIIKPKDASDGSDSDY